MNDFTQQQWMNDDGILNGYRMFLRKNVSLSEVSKSDFPYAVIVNLVYQCVGPEGLPDDEEELNRLDSSEEAVAHAMCRAYGAQFGLSVTTDGTRDLFFFLPSEPDDAGIEATIQAAEPSVDFDFSIHHDPEWTPYVELME